MLDKPKGGQRLRGRADVTVVDLVRDAYPRRQLFPAGRRTRPAPALCC